MKKYSIAASVGIAALVAAVTAGGALAADVIQMDVTEATTADYIKDNYWSGFYAGIYAGRAFTESNGVMTPTWSGGLRAGYLEQFGNFVVGGELEGSYDNKQDYLLPGGGILRQNWSGGAKLKAGYALDRVLLYGTAGVGVAYLETEGTVTSPDKWVYGATFGAGAEVGITDQVSANLEYTQARYWGVESVIGGTTRKDDLVNHAVKLGVNFHF